MNLFLLKKNKPILFYVLYIVVTSMMFLASLNLSREMTSIRLFFQDDSIRERIHAATTFDPSNGSVTITRMFHNKVVGALNNYSISLIRPLDLPFLFSLAPKLKSPFEPLHTSSPLFLIEFPFFCIAVVFLVRHSEKYKRKYYTVFVVLISVLLMSGLLYPALHPLKLLPVIIAIRTILYIGMYEFFISLSWSKKLY